MNELVWPMILWIVALTPYPLPQQPPSIEMVPPQAIYDEVCGGKKCPTLGYTDGGVVRLDFRIGLRTEDPFAQSVLLHELVHYEQEHSGRYSVRNCASWRAKETEAYQLQARWLREHSAVEAIQLVVIFYRLQDSLCRDGTEP